MDEEKILIFDDVVTIDKLPQTKHNLLQAILRINDLVFTSSSKNDSVYLVQSDRRIFAVLMTEQRQKDNPRGKGILSGKLCTPIWESSTNPSRVIFVDRLYNK